MYRVFQKKYTLLGNQNLRHFVFRNYVQICKRKVSKFDSKKNSWVLKFQKFSNFKFFRFPAPVWLSDIFLAGNQLYELKCPRRGWWCGGPKKSIAIFGYKQWLFSIEMKTKLVQNIQTFIHSRFPAFFSWEPALWTQVSQERVLLLMMMMSKKNHCHFHL